MRCSVTFSNPKQLLKHVTKFVGKIENKEIKCISRILRIKNGFKNILKWKSRDDSEYVDIKFNVLFNNRENTQSQIVEIQFLLSFLINAKKLGHKYYAIKRKDVYIDSISKLVYNNNFNYINYQKKIETLIIDNDITNFSKQLFLQPNIIFSMIGDNKCPILSLIGKQSKQYKMYLLFLNCLFHFGEILLNENEPNDICINYSNNETNIFDNGNEIYSNNKLFLQKYFNFSNGHAPLISDNKFVS